jgi:ABC-type branched-subunit amino acid transport system substrate-binding protein
MNARYYGLVLVAALTCAAGGTGKAAEIGAGVKDSEVVIGQCAALSGPAMGLGGGMNTGLKAAFGEINAKGGVHGRQIRFIAADDGYEPDKCVDCTGKMIEESGVFALAGYVGTPTAKVAAPMAEEYKIPLVGLFTGAVLLREPVQRYVVNIRASYDDETESLVEYLTKTAGAKKIAVFYQNDAFGLSGLAGVEKALTRRKLALAAKGSFERNTVAVQAGMAPVMESKPDVVIIVAPYKPTAAFVRSAKAAGLKSKFATISFVGTENLIAELGPDANSLLISQVVPSPTDTALVLARDYQAALAATGGGASPSYVSFEGYITGRVLIAALDRAGKDLSREKLIEAFHGMAQLDFGGMKISFSPTNHQGSNSVFLTTVKDGKATSIQ